MDRQVRLLGQTQGTVTLVVHWNDIEVWNGAVDSLDQISAVCSWTTDVALHGHVPLTIAVIGTGAFIWADLHMNYSGDYQCLPGAQSSGGIRLAPQDFYAPPCTQSPGYDGKSQICIDGVAVAAKRDPQDAHLTGAWHHTINAGSVLSCCYYVDRKIIRIYSPDF